jgi:hypothetical protein
MGFTANRMCEFWVCRIRVLRQPADALRERPSVHWSTTTTKGLGYSEAASPDARVQAPAWPVRGRHLPRLHLASRLHRVRGALLVDRSVSARDVPHRAVPRQEVPVRETAAPS